jgi:Protein of unknown function (DUF5818)
MMNKKSLPRLVLLLALVGGFCLIQPQLNAQQDRPPAAQEQQPDTSSQPAMMNQASDSQTFTGKITKSGEKFVLKDSASKSTYVLDDQGKAKQFVGQTVQVTGTLDAQSNTIRISSITPGS